MSLAALALVADEVNYAKSFGIGGLALAILVGLMIALIAFGGGRDHS